MPRMILAAAASFMMGVYPLAALAADQPAQNGPAVVQPTDPTAPTGSAENPIPKDDPVPASQADKLLPTDPGVVTNGPVPDTPANRAKYGQPMSKAGQAAKPAGN